MIAEELYRKYESQVNLLLENNRSNVDCIAIILCEQYFNSKFDRLLEYSAMPFLYLFNRDRWMRLSIGKGQIQIRHWIKYFLRTNKKSTLIKHRLENIILNYDVVEHYILDVPKRLTDQEILVNYTGELRKYHLDLFQQLKKKIAMNNK